MPKMARLLEQVRRQQIQQRRLDQQQRIITQVGGQRLDLLDEQMAQIQTNTGRIEALEQKLAELDEDLTKHWNDDKRHTGKAT